MVAETFVRVAGRLQASGEFQPEIGWETELKADRPRPDPDYRLDLVDGDGAVLAEGGVEVRAPICGGEGGVVTAFRIVGYVPVHQGGRDVVLRRGDQELYRAELAPERPVVARVEVSVEDDGNVVVRWEAVHDRPLRYRLLLVDGARHAIPITDHLVQSEVSLSAGELCGGRGCSVAVVATDGLRSGVRKSDPFDLLERPPSVEITSPADGQLVLPDHPVTLLGRGLDHLSAELPQERLVWSVDGQAVGRGHSPGVAGPFEPGEHLIELAYRDGEGVMRAEARVGVPERSPEQKAWLAVSAELSG